MTGIAAELMRAAPVLAAVAAVAAIFPRRAVGFAASDPRPAEPSAAFVELTEDEEDEAVKAAKTAWLASGGRRGRGAGVLSLGERMKCEFIMAMLHSPGIVFPDETTIGFDVILIPD